MTPMLKCKKYVLFMSSGHPATLIHVGVPVLDDKWEGR